MLGPLVCKKCKIFLSYLEDELPRWKCTKCGATGLYFPDEITYLFLLGNKEAKEVKRNTKEFEKEKNDTD